VTVTVACTSISGFAYIIGSPAPGLAGYSIASQTGELTPLPGSPFTNPSSTLPSDVAAAPDGKHIYVAIDETIYAYAVTQPPSPQMGMLTLGGTTTIDQINRLAIDPTGRFLYATSAGAVGSQGYVAAFTIGAETGVLTAIANYPSGSNPAGISVYPTGRYLLVTNLASNDVSSFSIDASAGTLGSVPGSPFTAGRSPVGVAVTPNGKFAYVTNYGANDSSEAPFVSSYTVDSSTGILTPIPGGDSGGPDNPTSVIADPSGNYLFVSSGLMVAQDCFSINQSSGVPIFPCPFTYPPGPSQGTAFFAEGSAAYAFDPTGQFMYVVSIVGTRVLQFSSVPANLTLVQSIPFPAGGAAAGIALAPVN
jgi:6-phosphogluconolactonase